MLQLLTTTTDALTATTQRYDALKEQSELSYRNMKILEDERLRLRRAVEMQQQKMTRLSDRLQVSLKEKGEWKELFNRAQQQFDLFGKEEETGGLIESLQNEKKQLLTRLRDADARILSLEGDMDARDFKGSVAGFYIEVFMWSIRCLF